MIECARCGLKMTNASTVKGLFICEWCKRKPEPEAPIDPGKTSDWSDVPLEAPPRDFVRNLTSADIPRLLDERDKLQAALDGAENEIRERKKWLREREERCGELIGKVAYLEAKLVKAKAALELIVHPNMDPSGPAYGAMGIASQALKELE